jgi:hypothetical protein
MAYQATMTITQGDCGGLMFRSADLKNFSTFYVCQDGTYNLVDFVADQPQPLYPQFQVTSAIHQGMNQQNVIAVSIQADTIDAYVNGLPVDTVQDANFNTTLKQGGVGLLAEAIHDTTLVSYTNATVWTK